MGVETFTVSRQQGHVALARCKLYHVMSMAFQPPEPEKIHGVFDPEEGILGAYRKLQKYNPLLDAQEVFNEWPRCKTVSAEMDTEEVVCDYGRLFLGPGHIVAPPYESVYRDPKGWVMGEWAIEVRNIYEASGLAIADSFKELPDHIAAELAFMAYLCDQERYACDSGDLATAQSALETQADFLDKHLSRWVPQFCDKIVANASTPLYRSLARLLRQFIELEMVQVAR